MLTRSEIELLQQDLSAALKVVGPDEIQDAEALLHENGFSAEEVRDHSKTRRRLSRAQSRDRPSSFAQPIGLRKSTTPVAVRSG